MRLWHKDLIPVLPRQQLLGQWRECCLIARNIAEQGSPNHLLVNRIMDYPIEEFEAYAIFVHYEMIRRGYKCDYTKFTKWINTPDDTFIEYNDLFSGWHNDRYLIQCLYNLQEKFDCGGIPPEEWFQIRANIRLFVKE